MGKIIVGIDEAGRGPLAGPVTACAITILQSSKHEIRNPKRVSNFDIRISDLKLRDSKQLTPRARDAFYTILTAHPDVEWGIGKVSEKVIDKINIFQATRLAMKKAVLSLERKLRNRIEIPLVPQLRDREPEVPALVIDSLIIDGNMLLDLPISQKAIPKADATIFLCMASSIIAKVTRDRLMLRLHKKYPMYGFDRHKGYGTKLHFAMLKKHGPCPIHRLSFAPCKQE